MSLHIFGALVTPFGTAANNRGETEGNLTTLQKLIWQGRTHTTVSAEAIRFALRRHLAGVAPVNRGFDEDTRQNTWQDPTFSAWASPTGETYIDDDLLGFMAAEAAKEDDAEEADVEPSEGAAKGKKKAKKKGTTKVRRAVLEVTRAVSLTPWSGDVTFNAASTGATPSAARKGDYPVPYGTEVHATRYQYGFSLTPERLREPGRARQAIMGLVALRSVAGNQARFLFDFAPDAVVFRVSQDPAPRILYCFETEDGGRTVSVPELVRRVQSGDVPGRELIIGGRLVEAIAGLPEFEEARLYPGVRAAAEALCARIGQ